MFAPEVNAHGSHHFRFTIWGKEQPPCSKQLAHLWKWNLKPILQLCKRSLELSCGSLSLVEPRISRAQNTASLISASRASGIITSISPTLPCLSPRTQTPQPHYIMRNGIPKARNKMDEYDKKFAEMQKYIPFLEAMIERLQNSVKDKDSQTREIQLQKMESLHGILSNSRRKLKIETLQRCEDVLQKLYNKVEKFQGNGSGLQLSFKQNDDVTSQPSTSSMKTKSNQCNEVISTNADNDKEGIEETPQSPDTIRSSSPDCQILPIIIPMERNAKLKNRNRRPQEQQRSKVIPVITLSDTKTITISSPDSNPDEVTFNEWDMLEESERQNSRNNGNRQSSLPVATSHDVTTAAKLISNNLPQKVSDNRNYMLDPQDIPTVPVPSLGGSRRLSSVLEKNKLTLDIMASCSRSESPVNVPEVRLNSPDPEILFAKPKPTSPRSNDSTLKPPPSKPPSIPLLFSPPPLSHEPLLSMEDLAELLNDEGDGDKTNENVKEKNTDQISKNSVLEKEKLTSRKSLQNTAGVSPVKITSSIGPPRQSNDSHRSVPQALFSKFQEPRYADNYERHPRQRDIHSHESAKDKLITISEETPSQITVIHNTASKSDERNVSLYQRRSSVPPEGRKDASLPRPENEFVIGNDYYNMHANQIHWSSPTTTSDQFGNNQWTPSSYGGMTNSPLQPTQHPFQRPMEPQFRQNQFPPTLSAGPRPLINPTVRPDMSHVIRSENVREDISPLMPPGFSSQYRGFQINQGSYDPAFPVGGPTEYPHIRPTWESSANPSYENVIPCGIPVVESTTGTSHPRPNTPCPWGTTARDRDRSNINQSRYYERNRIELRPGFNRDGRRSDWSWDGHSDRENLNRFPSRDPRVRTEHNTTGARDQAKETGVSARDPRLSKDKHVNTSTKTKDSVLNERDPRKRLVTASTKTMPVTKEKQKSQKSLEKEKDKLPKDRMQSPLESLYGVIDTKASQNSGLQKFKIPKIKRSEPAQLNRIINETKEVESASSKLSRAKSNKNKEQKKSNKLYSKNKSKDVESAEVSSSSDGNRTTENLVQQNNVTKEEKSLSSSLEKSDKNETRIGEADSATNNSKSNHITKKGKTKESEMDGSKSKETVTKEWIEALIKESFESGEGKKLVEHAKLLQKFGEVLKAKNFKKIKKIIESESESNSDKDETIEAKKTQVKKKRRVIMSDSSDDECLAERLSILSTNIDTNDARELVSAISTDPKNSEENLEVTASSNNLNKKLTEDITVKKNDDLSESRDKEYSQVNNKVDNKNKDEQLEKKSDKNDRLENDNENTDIQSEIEKQSSRLKDNDKEKKQTKDNQIDQSTLEKSKDSTEGSREYLNQDDTESNIEHFDQDKDSTTQSIIFDITNQSEEVSIDKPKIKTKRRNSLEMLQEDIREMFISEGVVTATGHRMCRLSNSKKEETSNIAEKKITESNTETNESAANNAKRKSLRSRNVEESKSKAKSKDAKRMTRSLQSKKSIQNSDSEEDQPLALRTEKLLNTTDNSTSNQEVARSEESNDAIRRSKRVLRKDIIKEPRVVVEKADLTKIDSCKIMFDSSSDESFGIDVSELTAAVDISLRPEKQSDQDSIDTMIISSRRKNTNNTGKRNFKSKKSSALTDDKSEDGSSFTDEESVISDISMSSNTTVRKKMNSSGAARTTAREELLSNILVGLVPTAKKNTSVDKDNEVDFEEDANDPIAIEPNVKRSCIKKKKKKSGNLWKMGRLTTKKRKKKIASAASSKTGQTNVEINIESNISVDTVEANQSLLKDPVTEKTLEKVLDDNHVVVHAKVDSVEDEVKPFVNIDSFDVGFKDSSNFTTLSEPSDTHRETLNDSFLSIEESKSLIQMDIKEEVSSSSADRISANAVTGNKFFKESPKIVYDELMTELYRRIDIKHLIDYAWVGQDKYKCLLCFFTGKNIVYHYKINHPGMEVLISRLKSTDAKTAIMEAEHSVTTMDTSQSCKFRCRFCCFVTEGAADVALEAFYEHCTTHTGEYRFHCNNCSYQAVAKASMKTHYYKICRKNKTFNESASEDVVPREGGIYGYLCCSCNYVQLKRQNIEAHVEFWHREQMDTEILKINMSAITVLAEHAANNNEQSHELTSVNAEESFAVETKPQVLEFEAMECKDLMDIARIMESESNDNNTSECILPEQKPNENIQVKEEKTEEIPKLSQGEPEGSVSTSNLSVFVCPPDLENKEMEIQRERQKTMQEIANNIGILLKNYSKPGLSIIDKLQDKMRTDAVVSPVPECNASANISETKENPSLPFVNSSAEPLKTEEELIIKEDIPSQSSNQSDSLSFMEEQLATEKSKATNDVDGKTDVKIRDPLVIMDPSKDNESDGENSDNERSAPIFESDSSSEQSDSEQTDVNMILKETSSINASSSRDPMLTTIQRLAAQLQNVKPLEPMPPEPMIDIKTEIKIEPVEPLIPKPPDVVPIASVKHLLKQNVKCSEKNMPASSKNASPPKNFLRFRRLSGDMLSMPMQFLDNQEDSQGFNTDGTQSDSAIDGLKMDTEEECSFLKIENVRSLAESDPNESVTVNDTGKAVDISPTKNKESVLKKSNQPLILKKISPQALVNMNLQTPKMQSVTAPLTSSSTSPSTLNYRARKIKVIRMPVLNNTKDTSPASFAIKLKSMEVYARMLTEPKLAHFYKCMSHNCSFTTDFLLDYSKHYTKHYEEASEQNSTDNYDKCAYCYISTNNWNEMKTHLANKHLHCRYQCGYCFYRSFVPSYVRQHQIMCHPNTVFYYLLDKKQKLVQKKELVNRNAYVLPFICKQDDCDKIFYIPEAFITHLKTKHSSSHLVYKCHVCNTTHTKIELLISHYKLHGFCKYQCLYCFYGSDTLNEIHQHLSTFHYDRLPQVLERSLPPMPSRQVEVIHQLILRTFDDNIDEESINLNTDNSKKNTSVLSNVGKTLNEAQSNQPKNLKGDILIGAVNDLKNTEVNVSNISTKQSTGDTSFTNINKNTNNSVEKQLLKNELFQSETGKLSDYTINQILQQSKLDMPMNDSGAVDSLKISDEFNCSDEFLNTNLLDNADFLKNFTSNFGNMFSKSADKTEDSDIEILESEEKAAQYKAENEIKKKAELMSETEVENKAQVASSDTTETKCTSKKAPVHTTNATAQPDKPLTLDDIKDTGRIGHELYKCGYLHECSFTAQNMDLLKAHVKTCNLGDPRQNLFCPHCKKRAVKISLFLEHIKTHGLKRFGCSLCKLRYSVSYQATAHMKSKHKFFHTRIVPADPTNPAKDGLFIVQAVPYEAADRRNKKRKRANKSGTEQENEKSLDNEKLSFSPDEIEQLPRQAIYNREVQCAVCPYTTKVRTNIIRHLQLHAKDETVPESGPVNPVPCLDKKEKMFDKMVNLASSSHQNGRMGAKPKESIKESEADDSIPKFVPEHKRYVCGVAECNYLTVNEAMLKYHLKALHSEEPYFHCPHCPPPSSGQDNQNIAIDKMGIHLRMHDTRLYKCSHCNHHHYHRHVVERHLTDKHPEKRPFVKVIREMENTENVQQSVPEETEEEVPDPDGNHWKCNLCDFKFVYKADVATHADTVHGESSQYKCTLCPFKTSGKILLEQHINSKHTYDSNADYTTIYQRIKGVNKRNTETVDQGGQEEPFDTTPLWSRNMPRVRHIRGILLEEETETPVTNEMSPVTSKLSLGKRKSDAEIVMKPAKIKVSGKSISLDENNKLSKEKSKRSLSCDKVSGEAEGEGHIMKESAQSKVTGNKSAKDSMELIDGNDSDVGRFGPYGKPDANMYVCTLCNQFKSKYKHDMRDHLYRELNYVRFHCKTCGYVSVNRKALLLHIGKRHNGEGTDEPLSPDNAIEDWVMTLLKKQTDMIKAWNHMNVIYKNIPVNASSSSSDVSSIKISADKKSVNLASTISNLQKDVLEDINKSTIDSDDGDSRDNEDLVIDMKEDEVYEVKSNEDKSENDKLREKTDDDLDKPIVCKHCQTSFAGQRGFKLHVQYSHLKRLGFLCPYCDRSTNSQTMMRQHIRAKHPHDPERIIHNPDAWGNTKLSNEFWEKEYGLPPLKTKKRKLNTENNVSTTAASATTISSVSNRLEKCEVCNFTAVNYTGLRSHMRTHSHQHNLKCLYCTYSCSYKAEMVEHWESNHPSVPLKYTERLSATDSSSSETKTKLPTPQKQDVDTLKNEEGNSSSAVIYGCVYCNLRSVSLPSIKQHWNLMHKDLKGSKTSFTAKFPFKFKEILVSRLSKNPTKKNVIKRNQAKQTKNLLPVIIPKRGWICQWCQELCETNNDRIRHHNMFHSHLPQKWKEQQQQKEQAQADTSIRLPAYSTEKYATNSKNLSSFESVVENLITKHVNQIEPDDMKNKNDQNCNLNTSTSKGNSHQAVARKSTTKSAISCARPGPRVFKAVARKSTNPRYPPNFFKPLLEEHSTDMEYEEEEIQNKQFVSHYGIPSSPVNLTELNTYMVVGGHSMRVNCLTLATLINIKPKILVKDIRKDPKYTAILSNLN